MKSSKITTNIDLLTFCAFFMLYSMAFSSLLGSSYPVSTTFYDLWLPQISGHAMLSGLSPNIDFYSPFGIIYHKLNQLSYSLILAFPASLQNFDINMLNSIVIALFMTSLFILFRLIVKLPFYILLFVTSITLQMRHIDSISKFIDPTTFSWSGIYNNQMWGLIILQISLVFAIDKYIRCKILTNKKLYLLSCIQGLISFIAFNFKINFFPATILINASLLCWLKPKQRIQYLTIITLALIILSCSTCLIFNYSYAAYFTELELTFTIKQSIGDIGYISLNQLAKHSILIISYITAMLLIRYGSPAMQQRYPLSFKQIISSLKTTDIMQALNQKKLLKNVFFDLCFVLAVIVIIAGDTLYPSGYMHIITILLLYAAINTKNIKITSIPHMLLGIIILINILSLSLITNAKFNSTIINNADSKLAKLTSATTEYKFSIANYNGLEDLLTKLNNKDQQQLLNFSYQYAPFKQNWRIPFYNLEYINMINNSLKLIRKLNTQNSNKIFMLGFANPLPMLLDLPYPKDNYHWLDIFITYAPDNMRALDKVFNNSDFIYMPIFTTDKMTNPIAQTFLNCYFYKWNFINKKFALINVDEYGLTFNKKASNSLPEIILPPQTKINSSCEKIEETIYADYKAKKPRSKKLNMLSSYTHK